MGERRFCMGSLCLLKLLLLGRVVVSSGLEPERLWTLRSWVELVLRGIGGAVEVGEEADLLDLDLMCRRKPILRTLRKERDLGWWPLYTNMAR